jgi:hypothetical protein
MHIAPVFLYPKFKGETHMSHEIRKVPANWQHPKKRGSYIPLFNGADYERNVSATWPVLPKPKEYMPVWTAEEATHFMMYETCTEGTPISPAFATIEELARYLADTGASAFGSQTADYDHWLKICKGKVVPVSLGGGIFAI